MPINSLFNWYIRRRMAHISLVRDQPVEAQLAVFAELMQRAAGTAFGKEHGFGEIRTVRDFKRRVPVRTYDDIKPWIERARAGEGDVLWPGRTQWFAKSSGTTADRSKFLPVTEDALASCHYAGGKDLLALYCSQVPEARLYQGRSLVLGGSSELHPDGSGGYTGDLSAIMIRNLPFWVEARRTPGRDIALMAEWERKVDAMAEATRREDVRVLAGVPSWMLVVAKRVLELSGASSLGEVWPNLQLFMHGGVSYTPYRAQFDSLFAGTQRPVDCMETYNASEGFFGIQDRVGADDLLMMLDYGIFFEFMPLSELGSEHPETLELRELEVGREYALVISTNGGLWRYLLGDVVRITELHPFRMQVAGRTSMCLNAFGEELMVAQAERGIADACAALGATVRDFTAAPIFMDASSTGGHEWLVEFEAAPSDLDAFTRCLDDSLQSQNSDYAAKRTGNLAIVFPVLRAVPPGTFEAWLRDHGKLGGQHKVPRLSPERRHLEEIWGRVGRGVENENEVEVEVEKAVGR